MTISTKSSYAISAATTLELFEVAEVKARSWAESFDFPESVIETQREMVPESVARWQRLIADGGYVWQARERDTGRIVGAAQAAPAVDSPTSLLLDFLYVLAEAKDTGLAEALLQYAIGDCPAHLWVIENNARARAFYTWHGFVADGTSRPMWRELRHLRAIRLVRPQSMRSE